MKKVIVLSTVLGLSALGMACGEAANTNTANKPANNANVATPAPAATAAPATTPAANATVANATPAASATKPAANADTAKPANK